MMQNRDSLWVEPTQDRSRKKVERILDAALELAVKSGSLDYKVTEVAKLAGVAVGTLYQFFPSRSALTAKLFAREMAPIDASIVEVFQGDMGFTALGDRVRALMLQHLTWVKERPGLSVIWSGAQIDPVIEAADLENTRQNAERLAGYLSSYLPAATQRSDIEATALLICHLWSSVIRLSVLLDPPQQSAVIEQYADMIMAHGASLMKQS